MQLDPSLHCHLDTVMCNIVIYSRNTNQDNDPCMEHKHRLNAENIRALAPAEMPSRLHGGIIRRAHVPTVLKHMTNRYVPAPATSMRCVRMGGSDARTASQSRRWSRRNTSMCAPLAGASSDQPKDRSGKPSHPSSRRRSTTWPRPRA